ncbi:MAG: 5'-nucleotidase, lipoprotein e(P4) family [Balneolaceae bacterium]|nr:5'-nucleotidase, lipoprotein e(P4) family [Balneolaceae bacterium]
MKKQHQLFRSYHLYILLFCCIIFVSCSSTQPLQNPTTSATLWMQNAAEYKALTTMVYQSAANDLGPILNKNETASLEQEGSNYQELPPAVILDVDETVLDNSPFQARLIKQNETYTPEKWNEWVREEQAEAIAGALAFTKAAADKGITVFYLTNREAQVEEATFDNLKELGFPLREDVDVLLTKNERPDWTSAKVNRRMHVAENYNILMLFGDNLNDFLPAEDITHEERQALIDKHRERFGTQWFVLPNPVYGSWEQALYDFEELTEEQVEQEELKKLKTKN